MAKEITIKILDSGAVIEHGYQKIACSTPEEGFLEFAKLFCLYTQLNYERKDELRFLQRLVEKHEDYRGDL